jgi:hypothetical protein
MVALVRPLRKSATSHVLGERVPEHPGVDAEHDQRLVTMPLPPAQDRQPTTVEQGHHHHLGQDAGQHQVVDGVDGQGAQGVDLLGHGHGAQLGGGVGAHPAAEHQADEQRADLAKDARSQSPSPPPRRPAASRRSCRPACTVIAPAKKAVTATMGRTAHADAVEAAPQLEAVDARTQGGAAHLAVKSASSPTTSARRKNHAPMRWKRPCTKVLTRCPRPARSAARRRARGGRRSLCLRR